MSKRKYKEKAYRGAHKCGHEAEYTIGGFSEYYRKAEAENRFSEDCPQCLVDVAVKEAEEAGLVALEGTEKQVNWAMTIRQELIDMVNEKVEDYFSDQEDKKMRFLSAFSNFLAIVTSASTFIDYRHLMTSRNDYNFSTLVETIINNYEITPKTIVENEFRKKLKEEAAIYPENYNGVDVELVLTDKYLRLDSPKNDEIIALARRFNYKWIDRSWKKYLDEFTDDPHDRVAEMGNHLLNAGFGVIALGTDKDKMINADYLPETDQWIVAGDDEHLRIRWHGYDDEIYNSARRLPNCFWQNDSLWVPIAHWREVTDFAEIQNFQLSKGAKDLIERQKHKEETVIRTPVAVPANMETSEEKLTEILESSADILEDLRDD